MNTKWLIENKCFRHGVIHLHMALTAAAVLMCINYVYIDFGDFYMIFGNHTVIYPFFGAYMAAEREWKWVTLFCLIFWGPYILAFSVTYLIAAMKKKYTPLMVVSWIDAVFSALMLVAAIDGAGFYSTHLMMITGVVLSGAFAFYLNRVCRAEI